MKELIIKKSKFISVIYDINNIDDIKKIHISLKEEHKKAKHVVYGYILDQNTFGYNDDKEPQGSAGLPIVNLLKIKKQTNKWYEPQILDFLIVFGLIPVLNRTKSF